MPLLKRLSILLPPVFFIIAVLVVHHELKAFQLDDLKNAILNLPQHVIILGFALTALNYATMSFYDWLALRYAGQKVPLRKVLLASSIAYSISNNTGHALISGTSVRYRFYTKWGVPGWEIIKVSAFLALTFIVGIFTLEVISVIGMPRHFWTEIATPTPVYVTAGICALCVAAYWTAILVIKKPLKIKDVQISAPTPVMALLQTGVATLDVMLAGSILYIFLRETVHMSFLPFLTVYATAIIFGLASQVPGGLGIFESTFMWMAATDVSSAEIMGALIVYRIVYYVVPLVLAGVFLFFHETQHTWNTLSRSRERVAIVLKYTIPRIYAPLLAASGTMLLVSGAIPALPTDIAWIKTLIPLSVLEFSHLMGSLIGLLLLFLSRGVFLRLDAAYYGCLILLALGIASSMVQSIHWSQAVALGVVLMLFLPTKRYFDRKSSLLTMSWSPAWVFMVVVVLAGTVWIGFFSHKHVEYASEIWWKFSFKDDAPRFLRAMAATTFLAVAFSLYRLLGVARPLEIMRPTEAHIEHARHVAAAAAHDTTGFLAMLGDKQLLWSDDGNAYIQFAMTRHYWIAMGDPVGDPSCFSPLLWRFREKSDKAGAKAVFYEVSEQHLPLYLDLGLALLKVGEEARVDLQGFTLEGGAKENQRKLRNRFDKQGCKVRFLEPHELEKQLPVLKTISDQWLAMKSAQEKGFSLGFFSLDYLRRTQVAVVEQNGTIFAFANVLGLDNKNEITVDLMRYAPDAPVGTMEFLFLELILWAQEQGYKWFDLGMAPLSGMERHPLAPLWHKIGTLIYHHGEEFYNFEGLHAYKDKFNPVWRARYLASPPGPRLPLVLINIVAVISGHKDRPDEEIEREKAAHAEKKPA
ncbi:MAG TPA: bifunctional lysylphosphatidylglycerol flippase/synthetase MprF [Patescibacteria group bacterium]|nr:bifunctional lysylphosphatidylglycerol flippase/synthetase MprF [Patescibacteria group bacterium]